MEASIGEDQIVVYRTDRWNLAGKKDSTHVLKWREGMRIRDAFGPTSYESDDTLYFIERFLDARTKTEISSDQLVEKSGVYAIEGKEQTITIRLKVNDEEPKKVEVPFSLLVSNLGRSQGISMASVAIWHPISGYTELNSSDRQTFVQEAESYWIKSDWYDCIRFGNRVSAAVNRYASKLTGGEQPEDVEEQRARKRSKIPTGCPCCLLTSLAIFCFVLLVVLLGVFAFVALWPAANGVVPKEAAATNYAALPNVTAPANPTAPTPHMPGNETASNRTVGKQVSGNGTDIGLVLLKLDAKLDRIEVANKAERKELHDRLQRMEDEHKTERAGLLETIGKLEERIADLNRVNVSVVPTPLYTCEPKPRPTPTTTADKVVVGGILVLLVLMIGGILFCT